MTKAFKPIGIYTEKAKTIFKKSPRLYCQVKDNKIYITDGYIAFIPSPLEYDYYFRPVTGRDAGNWQIIDGLCSDSGLDISKTFEKAAQAIPADRQPISFQLDKITVNPIIASNFVSFIDSKYLDCFSFCSFCSLGDRMPSFAFYGDEVKALLLPMRIKDDNKIAAVKAFVNGIDKQIESLKKENANLKVENARLQGQLQALTEEKEEKKSPQDLAASLDILEK